MGCTRFTVSMLTSAAFSQLQALRAYCDTGTVKGAAHVLGLSERQIRRRMQALRDKHHCTTAQLARMLGRIEGPDQLDLRLVA